MCTWISPGRDNPKELVVFRSPWTWIFHHLGTFPAPPKVIPAFLSMDPWLLDPCGSLFSPSSWEREESPSTLLRFLAVLIQNGWKSWEKSPWINIPRDKHPSQSTATSGGERGNFPWTSFGISGLSNISNASIKCSNAKFLARFPDARQGTERN